MLRLLLVNFLLFALTACATPAVKLNLSAHTKLNQDTAWQSLPVLVRVYTLNNDNYFNDATFRALWHNDKAVLGESLIARQELFINPHSNITLTLPGNKQAKYLAVVALFRHPHGESWRVIRPISNPLARMFSAIEIQLSGNTITLE